MKKLAVVGLVGAALAVGYAGIANASDERVTPAVTIESVPADVGYAVSEVRSSDLQQMADQALAEPDVGSEITGTVGSAKQASAPPVAQPEQKIASAATTTTVTRPEYESDKSVTSEPVKRKVQKASARADKKRVTLPVPVIIGAFR